MGKFVRQYQLGLVADTIVTMPAVSEILGIIPGPYVLVLVDSKMMSIAEQRSFYAVSNEDLLPPPPDGEYMSYVGSTLLHTVDTAQYYHFFESRKIKPDIKAFHTP